MRLVEPYAGLAGLSLWVLWGLSSPASRVGNKSKYAPSIAGELCADLTVDSALLVDADPAVVNFWKHVPQLPEALADRMGQAHKARPLWEAARADRDHLGPGGAAAWLLWTAGARGGIGGFKGGHKHRPNVDGFIPSRSSLLQRVRVLAECWDGRVAVQLGQAEDVVFGPDDIAYLDPPYPKTQGYARKTTMDAILQTWEHARAAQVRGLSANAALAAHFPSPNWVQIARRGQMRRSLTRSDEELLLVDRTR